MQRPDEHTHTVVSRRAKMWPEYSPSRHLPTYCVGGDVVRCVVVFVPGVDTVYPPTVMYGCSQLRGILLGEACVNPLCGLVCVRTVAGSA